MTVEISTIKVICEVCNLGEFNDEIKSSDYGFQTCSNTFIYKRSVCGHWFLENRPVESEMVQIYPESYGAYTISSSSIIQSIRRLKSQQHFRLLQIGKSRSEIVDYGCGSGEWLSHVSDALGPKASLIGVDFLEEKPKLLDSRGIRYLQNANTKQIADSTVDSCRMVQVIEHLSDPKTVLREVHRFLKPAGLLLIETPVPMGWDFKLGKNGTWGGWHAPRHFHIFSIKSLHSILDQCGFDVVVERHIYGPYVWAETLRTRNTKNRLRINRFVNIGNPMCLAMVAALDALQRLLGRPTSNYRVIARSKEA